MNENTINDDVTMGGGAQGTLLAGRYRAVRQLGQGGMGSVWLAEDTQLDNRPVALKLLPSILVSNKRAYAQLKAEALVSLKLSHPNIVTLRAFEENSGNPFLVMDYIEGQTLDDYLAEKGTLTEEETLTLLKPIAAALDYAHGQGVVHRDVKPANVMIQKDGTSFILDFGIAREIQETMTLVTGKLSSGTLLYMSPEQLTGAAPKPPQDVYSFAAMVYECLTGSPPFCRGQIEYQIVNNPPGPLPYGIGIAASVMAGLAKDPKDRPADCAGVLVRRLAVKQSDPPPGIVAREPSASSGEAAPGSRTEASNRVRMAIPPPPSNRTGKPPSVLFVVLAILSAAYLVAFYIKSSNVKREKMLAMRMEQRRIEQAQRDAEREHVQAEQSRKDAEEADRCARTQVETVLRQAIDQNKRVSEIAGEDGFEARKRQLEAIRVQAEEYAREKLWADAARQFALFNEQAAALVVKDGERKTAVERRDAVREVRNEAERIGARQALPGRWSDAVALCQRADDEFARMDFVRAGETYAEASGSFRECLDQVRRQNALAAQREAARLAARPAAPAPAPARPAAPAPAPATAARRTAAPAPVPAPAPVAAPAPTHVQMAAQAPVPAPAAQRPKPSVLRRVHAYEARIAPYVMENGTKRYVSASYGGIPSGLFVRTDRVGDQCHIVIGAAEIPEGALHPNLT